jgi:hypothetical protein
VYWGSPFLPVFRSSPVLSLFNRCSVLIRRCHRHVTSRMADRTVSPQHDSNEVYLAF